MIPTAAPVAALANDLLFQLALRRLDLAGRSDPDLGRSVPLPAVVQGLQREGLAAVEMLARACEAYRDRPALGERAVALEGTAARPLPAFRTLSYGELWRNTVDLATGLARDPRTALRPGEVVGICGSAGPDYVLADLACLYLGVVSALVPAALAPEELRHLAVEAAFACIVCTPDSLPGVRAVLGACPSVRSVVVMGLRGAGIPERTESIPPLLALEGLAAAGAAAAPLAPFLPPRGSDPLATLMYTSGSTGMPKGARLTHAIWRSHWSLDATSPLARIPHIGISFYPLSHAMGRLSVLRALVLGGVTHFTWKRDLSTLFEDIRLVRPTFLNLVPRVADMVHQEYQARLRRALDAGGDPAGARERVSAEMRSTFLGDRLVAAVVGSAPTAPEVVAFLKACFQVPVFEGYGSTEAGIVAIDGRICRPLVVDYKLADVPELGYRRTDQPFPRGELRVKTRQCVPGYLHNPEATRALYDEDGYLRTGDIVEERGPDQVVWIDRRNNVVKLAQGEFITLGRLESVFAAGSPFLEQIHLYADGARAYPLAVVVPHWPAVRERLGPDPDPGEVRRLARAELDRVAAEAGLRPFEVPRDFLVEKTRWTRDNGMLTGVDKPARARLERAYGERLEALYARTEDRRREALAALARDPGRARLDEPVRRAAEAVLGVDGLDLSRSFADLGGDSMSALDLATLLEEMLGTPVPVADLLNPAGSLRELARRLEARGSPGAGHRAAPGPGPGLLRAEDLRLASLFSAEELDGAASAASRPLPAEVRTVLLTGASGFLGRALALEWLEHAARVGGRVVCLVRAADDAAAAVRLRSAFQGPDPDLERRFAALASRHLDVLAGDLAAPGLGLAPERLRLLAEEVDLIVHAGALVNHALGYEQLFGPNVLGTARLALLAVRGRRKRIDHVSTLGVLAGARSPGKVLEDDGVDALLGAWPAAGGHAYGYAASKWAGEVLLRDLHQQFGTPVRVFRCGLVMPHRRYRGQANVPDLLTRLLASVIHTGLAPRSFYAGDRGRRAHFDGLPVDFIASAMAALSSAHQEGHATYQVSSAHRDDGVSLDTLVDWVQSAGYRVERIPDHAAWFQAFGARLRELPGALRQHSSLPILAQWAEPLSAWEAERIDATRFVQQVRRLHPGGEADLPRLDEAYLHKYLDDLQALGIVGPAR
ncbi:MAG: thioester reductase domain-containing protein [Holophaga sp.]|jgi:fatty acid CoA ligase FadD9